MSQSGHIVKPTGKRKTWAIIYPRSNWHPAVGR